MLLDKNIVSLHDLILIFFIFVHDFNVIKPHSHCVFKI